MKKLLLVSSLLLAFGISSFAQLSRDEEKEWKMKYKAYKKDIEGFKYLVEENGLVKGELSNIKKEFKKLKNQIATKDKTIYELQDEIARLKSKLDEAKSATKEVEKMASEQSNGGGSTPQFTPMSISGLVFKVQIGAFEKKDLSKFFDNNPMFTGEVEGAMQKITVGFFRDYWEADTFKKHLREMGVKDAWVIPYKEGVRVSIKEVLEKVM